MSGLLERSTVSISRNRLRPRLVAGWPRMIRRPDIRHIQTDAGGLVGSALRRPGEPEPRLLAVTWRAIAPRHYASTATLRRGDSVYVRRADGSLAVFGVTAVKMYPKDRFPAAAVYGPTPDAELRLITCGGTFDQSLGSYLSNVVVYATAVAG